MTQKEIIVEKASQMFVTQGIKAVRMDDIAQELSISKRTLYELFGDKEELIYQSICHYIAQSKERRKAQCGNVDNILEVMLISLRDMINHAPIACRMRRNLQRFYPSVFSRIEGDAYTNTTADLSSWIKECVACGYFTQTADSNFVVKVLHSSVQGLMMGDSLEREDAEEVICTMTYAIVVFLRGLCSQSGMEVIDRCFGQYFGNIVAQKAL